MSVQVTTFGRSSVRAPGDVREVAVLAYPVVLQTIAETLMQVIDSAMVGRLGATEFGAIGFAGIWVWTLFVPFTGTATGVQVFVSRHDGAGERERCGPWIWQALWLLGPAMIVWMGIVWLLLPHLVAFIGPSAAMQSAAIDYADARLLGGPAVLANFVLTSFLRGIGDTRTPLLASLLGIIVNVAAAWGLIFGHFGLPALGVAGAGFAMAAGSITICAGLLVAVLRHSVRERYRTAPSFASRPELARFLRTSAPIGGQWLLDMASFAVFTSIVARMGDVSMAASQAMLQLLSISFMQAMAVSVAAGTLVGRYLGANDPDAAARSYRSAQFLAIGIACVVGLLFVSVPGALLSIFSRDPAVLRLARPLLLLGALFQAVDAVGIIAGGALRGAGDTHWPFITQATLAWILRLPLVYVAAVVLHGGVLGAWVGELVYLSVLSVVFMRRFQAGAWRKIQI
jgi:MATE family multidrug resistance protein